MRADLDINDLLDCHPSGSLTPLSGMGALPVVRCKPLSRFHVLITVNGKPMPDPDDRPGPRPRTEVEHLELAMRRTLKKNAHKEHWRTLTPEYLYKRLLREMVELDHALASGDRAAIRAEAVDVMTLAGMLYDVSRD
jgi:hypothetical protein